MRDPKRISSVLKLVEDLWRKDPDFRLIQLIEMIKNQYSVSRNSEGKQTYYYKENGREIEYSIVDLFHLEDDVLENFLRELIDKRANTI